MQLIGPVIDALFGVAMWFLLDPLGKKAFWLIYAVVLAVGLTCLRYAHREYDRID